MPSVDPDEVAAAVAASLEERADASTRDWWTKYLKGEAEFRGVKMADTRKVVRAVDGQFGLGALPVDALLDVTDRLFAVDTTEDKLAAVLLLAERHLDRLRTEDVPRLARPLADDELADWNSCDWYCVKVLGPFVEVDEVEHRARAIASWSTAPGLWQRRAAAVSFVNVIGRSEPFAGFDELMVEVAERNVADPTRWSQTSVGWLLRELSDRAPDLVVEFVERHGERMSTEARRAATARLPK
ncbi:MAG: DNA alkylation repair protein [Actinomycetota bacterium]